MKRSLLTGCALSLAIAATVPVLRVRADGVSVEDAQKQLAEKQEARQKSRAAMVQISAGELEDLRAKVSSLQSQLDAMKVKQGSAGATASAPKRYDEIELGMTKTEVKAFVEQHKPYFTIVAIKASNGVSKTSQQVVVRETGQSTVKGNGQAVVKASGQATIRHGAEGTDLAGTGHAGQLDVNGTGSVDTTRSGSLDANDTRNVEVTTNHGRREIIEIAKWVTVREQTGSHTAAFGQVHADYSDVTRRAGTISVTLDDDVVTAVDAR